jgi:hypothetical protein
VQRVLDRRMLLSVDALRQRWVQFLQDLPLRLELAIEETCLPKWSFVTSEYCNV